MARPSPDDAPVVALVIATHQRPDFLRETLASAYAQTYPGVRIVISDDGSTDPALLALLDACDAEGITVLRHPHRGFPASLNAAIAATPADYVMVLGDDDLIEPPYIAEAVAAAEADPSVGIVYCRADLFGTVEGPWRLPPFEIGPMLLDNRIFTTALMRRADWEAVGGFDETMTDGREDHDFWLRILGLGRGVAQLPHTYFHYRQHGSGSMNKDLARSREKLVRAHATMLRTNLALYEEHAEEFWALLFDRVDEINDLRHRYRHLEALRARHPRLLAAAQATRRLKGRLRRRGRRHR